MNTNHSVRLPDTSAKIHQPFPKRFGNTALITHGTAEVLIIPTTSASIDTDAVNRGICVPSRLNTIIMPKQPIGIMKNFLYLLEQGLIFQKRTSTAQ